MSTTRVSPQSVPPDARVSIGIDVGKDSHWVTAITDLSDVLYDARIDNTPAALHTLTTVLDTIGGARTIGVDMLGGMATLVTAMLLTAGEHLVHVPGKAVNRARTGFRSGDNKSDARDARVIADQVRTRRTDLRVLTLDDEQTAALKVWVARRRTLTVDQVRRITQLHEVLLQVHPGLDHRLDLRHRIGGLYLLTHFVTPQEIRDAGVEAIVAFLKTCPRTLPNRRKLAQAAVDAAQEQPFALPGATAAATVVRDLATDALATRDKLDAIDRALEAVLAQHPDAALVRSLPGMGVVTTAEFLAHAGSMQRYKSAHHLAAYAGLTPVIRQTGRTLFLARPLGGNKDLKRACCQAALVAIKYHLPSRIYYQRKRDEGKCHLQALLALARRRMIVLYAMLRDRTEYTAPHPLPPVIAHQQAAA